MKQKLNEKELTIALDRVHTFVTLYVINGEHAVRVANPNPDLNPELKLHSHAAISGRGNKSSPFIWEKALPVATSHGRECSRPLRVLLAAECPLQTSLL